MKEAREVSNKRLAIWFHGHEIDSISQIPFLTASTCVVLSRCPSPTVLTVTSLLAYPHQCA